MSGRKCMECSRGISLTVGTSRHMEAQRNLPRLLFGASSSRGLWGVNEDELREEPVGSHRD